MLKIEQKELASGAVVLRLEGSIIGAWLEELRQLTDAVRKRSLSVVIDLYEVSFVSREGIEFLTDRQRDGVVLGRMTPFVAKQLRGGSLNMNSIGNVVGSHRGVSPAPVFGGATNHAAHQEQRALEEFAARYGDLVLAESWRLLRNEEEALDLAHDVLCRAHRRSKARHLEGDLKLWLERLTAAAAIGLMRTASAAPDLELRHFQDFTGGSGRPSIPAWPKSADAPEFREAAQRHLRAALESLPLQLRAVLILKDFEKMPIAEIAVSLGVEDSRARYRLNEARLALTYRMTQAFARSANIATSTESVAIR